MSQRFQNWLFGAALGLISGLAMTIIIIPAITAAIVGVPM